MKVFSLIFRLEKNEKNIRIFNPHYSKMKYKCNFKIVYKNKIYSIQNELELKDVNSEQVKLKLISFINFDYQKESSKSYDIYKCQKYKRKRNNYFEYLKYSLYELSKIKYKIEQKAKEIRIFGSEFVKNNKEKCIIIYKDNFFPLKTLFSINDI